MNTKICARKDCRLVGIEQPINVFCIDRQQKSGRHPYCSECRNKLSKNRIKNDPSVKEKARQATIRYRKTDKGKNYTKQYYIDHKGEFRARERKYQSRPDVLLKKAKKQAVYRNNNILKEAARRCVNYAIKTGVINRPSNCEWCNLSANGETLQAHHWMGYDFENWFNVKFVHLHCHFKVEKLSPSDW